MEKTVKIKGMMCPHCEGRVKAALEALDAVDHAEVSHDTGTAVVTLRATVEDAALIKAVVDAGYQAKI